MDFPMTAVTHQSATESKQAPHGELEQCRALLGRRLADRFEVGHLLGYGGSSLIFEGWHLVLRHPVAVKVLRADYAQDPELVQHFAQEAMVTAQMRSPHVVRVFDTGLIDDALPYTVLELLRGQTLSDLRRNGRTFTPEEAVDLVLQACRALDESHSRGIIHRDIKPDNLFLAELPDGTFVLKVIDFGVAKHGAAHTFLTEAWVGTPGYMAPEQISTPGDVDHRADIWALGVVLFELLTGRSPFRGSTAEELLASTLRDEALPVEVAHQGLPYEVYEAVERCLAKDPARRFQSVQELAAKLVRARERFARGEELSTGIVRLPDNWDVRLTPPHGWSVPGPTVALKAPAVSLVGRRRLSLVAGVLAGALFGVAIANYPLLDDNVSVAQTNPEPSEQDVAQAGVAQADVAQAGVAQASLSPLLPQATFGDNNKPEHVEASQGNMLVRQTTARPEVPKQLAAASKPSVPLARSPLAVASVPSASVSSASARAIAPTPSVSVPTPVSAVTPRAVTAASEAPRVPNKSAPLGDMDELLTPWTKSKK
jgi:eukaryotic-like serine/threonine-protein kinase